MCTHSDISKSKVSKTWYFLQLWEFESHRLEPTKTFFRKNIISGIIKIISKSSPAWTAVFVYSCGSSLKFSPRNHGCPDLRTWRRTSRAATALFESWHMVKIASNWGKIPNLLQKNSVFRFFPNYFRCAFIFSYFFPSFSRLFFMFAFDFCNLFFFPFLNKIWKIPKTQKSSSFFRFFIVFLSFFIVFFFPFFIVFFSFFYRFFYRFLSFLFSTRKRIFKLFSNYFRSHNQFSSNFWLIFDLKTDFTAI